VSLQIPDTRVFEIDDLPTFAIHHIIPGKPLTSEMYEHLSAEARNRLVTNLAQFFTDMHAIPLTIASEWLGYPEDYEKQTKQFGKPGWFGGEASLVIRASLAPVLKPQEMEWLEEVIALFDALPAESDYMVFGHGDLHGYNMAIGEDALGPKMVGVFDLGHGHS
jgi:aminoglycoside phosphotransferase (APT) family kinase protein